MGNGTHSPGFDSSSTIPLWLDGKEVTTSKTFEVTSPSDQKVLYKVASASESDAQAALGAAQRAFKGWSATKPAIRRDIFLQAAGIIASRKEELWQYSHSETGVDRAVFEFEFGIAAESLKAVAGLVSTVQGAVIEPAAENSSAFMVREPWGVVLGIAPWNAPYALGLRSCLYPLATGNTVVLKGSEVAPATYWAISSVLHAAGLPEGCLNTIYHDPKDAATVTNYLISSPTIKKVNFTGSTRVGSLISSLAGKNLKPVLMELGGKAPCIICEDADLGNAAFQCALGAFLHNGQICMSTERILVNKNVAGPFKEALKTAMDQVFGHHATESPILINKQSVVKNKELLRDALDKGAKVIYGDAEHTGAGVTRMKPVIIEGVREGMEIYHTESFGPTVSVYEVDDDDTAIHIANDTDYGLTSAVFTKDLRRGLKIAKQIETGAVHINSMTIHDEAALPHGGAKSSGFGRFNGREGLEEWVRTKVITFDI